jgi:hypothetical protein
MSQLPPAIEPLIEFPIKARNAPFAHLEVYKLDRISLLLFFLFVSLTQGPCWIRIYPAAISLNKGKSRTVAAHAYDTSGNYLPNQPFTFVFYVLHLPCRQQSATS